jgi:acyl dehydratase
MSDEIKTLEELQAAVGRDLGVGAWFAVDQKLVSAFAELTGDRQYIHVDPDACKREGLEGTIAHGFLTLSLQPMLGQSRSGTKIAVPVTRAINYGLNKVRFIAPVPVPSRIRLSTSILSVSAVADDIVDVAFAHRVEIEGSDRPAMYAEAIDRLYLKLSPSVGP